MSDSAAVPGKAWRRGFSFRSALPLTFGVALLNLLSAFFPVHFDFIFTAQEVYAVLATAAVTP